MNPRSDGPSATELVRDLASRGRYHFSTRDAAKHLGVSEIAARSAIRRLKGKGLIAVPHRGFHVIVPPEYRELGCLPAEQFVPQLMEMLGIPYYAGLLTAARYHGAAHQQPQLFQVVVRKSRPAIRCGRVGVSFVARHNAEAMPTVRVNTPRGYLWVSSAEATAFDLVGYPQRCGGLGNVATVLAELAERLDPDDLRSIAELSPLPWSQRLGYLLERVDQAARARSLESFVGSRAQETVPLAPGAEVADAPRSPRWKLLVNADAESDL